MLSYCECGCGFRVKTNNRFLVGPALKNKPRSVIHSQRISEALRDRSRPKKVSSLCLCGCSELTAPGKDYRSGHNSRFDNPSKGKHLSVESRKKISFALAGRPGRHQTEVEREKRSISIKASYTPELRKLRSNQRKADWKKPEYANSVNAGKSEAAKKMWRSPSYREAHKIAAKKNFANASERAKKQWERPEIRQKMLSAKGKNLKPNKTELRVLDFLQSIDLDWKYTGDFKLIIGGKCPDYWNGKNKLVEFLGCYYHGCSSHCPDSVYKDTQLSLEERKALFFSKGFEMVYIWEHELKDLSSLEIKLKAFCGSS